MSLSCIPIKTRSRTGRDWEPGRVVSRGQSEFKLQVSKVRRHYGPRQGASMQPISPGGFWSRSVEESHFRRAGAPQARRQNRQAPDRTADRHPDRCCLGLGCQGGLGELGIILAILIISTVLDVTQEHRAEAAAEARKRSVAVRSEVKRDGHRISLPVERIVPGDIVMLRAGDLVPADGFVLDSRAAHANEALLTGGPYLVEKRPGPSDATTPADAYSALFGGTALGGGEATMKRLVRTAGIEPARARPERF